MSLIINYGWYVILIAIVGEILIPIILSFFIKDITILRW
ncbi:hypothetical protein J2S15_004082 [Breznakia pachnodae]|uniref:Uncharacterized protein n=1 Tax=Breznakia pachnodae TaxID=265178 RepID=A0ABU0E8U4_9FIRM|nr:hypothetical protein [Breznakia pachnodae]